MRSRIYKPALLCSAVLLIVNGAVLAQDVSVNNGSTVSVKVKTDTKDLQQQMDVFSKNLQADLKDLAKSLSVSLNNLSPKISSKLAAWTSEINETVNTEISISTKDDADSAEMDHSDDEDTDNQSVSEKYKSYSKSYSIDGSAHLNLDNQYGKITVTTWDKREIRVDVQIKAESDGDSNTQKLLDAVNINDSKNGNEISFRTDISHESSSWKIFSWGGGNKVRKLTINYTVYMPAKTDLDVEQSYGNISLPDLSGKVKISSSYGSVTVQGLSNTSNEIQGSYGSLKAGTLNGCHLAFSYGSVEIDESNNLKAELSYGSFKLGRLKGSADLDMSNVSGFRIGDVASTFRKININSSYSSVAFGVSDKNNFDFDVTTTYGGFSYNNDRVSITSKTPADGSRYFSNTKNYKGHYGKGGDAQIVVKSSYGGVRME